MLSLALVSRSAALRSDAEEQLSCLYKAGTVTQQIRSTSTMDVV